MTQQRGFRRRRGAAGEDLCGNAFAVVFVARRGFAAFGGSADEVGASARLVATFGVESLHAFAVADQIGPCDALQQRAQIGAGQEEIGRASWREKGWKVV